MILSETLLSPTAERVCVGVRKRERDVLGNLVAEVGVELSEEYCRLLVGSGTNKGSAEEAGEYWCCCCGLELRISLGSFAEGGADVS